ncbi:peptidylprolyl isomerase [Mycolicibacterium moriokaense]|uniref:FKBP-type peptidyl-prolyl cis-trans isomerase n=1 Tax=Mycolicibacterium moriokaense TaxID=39691 RepID=UPI0009F17F32|nr:FKBP-type peptidyl-prolyl cis-trans isomerase [Mycolicibacterium moriokaense]MCV7038347.1 FKBP-type peptidyl-prolyl cis-trans isomerase [Mycolicibacterium moriokaense]ORB24318.1 peptidylprolyl isomerase [Mycolicibacterium moriokaense]
MSSTVALAAGATLLVTTLAACGSDSDSAASSTSTTTTTSAADPFSVTETQTPPAAPAAASTCPTAAPADTGTPEWTLPGDTGSVSVTGSTDTTAPNIKVDTPFSVSETTVQTLQPGDGPVVADTATVSVCYMGVNGRDGSVFDSSYQRGYPEEFPLNGVVPGFQKAIAGQKVGSTVAVAMTSADGYADGQPAAGILPGDTLVFAIKILDASS